MESSNPVDTLMVERTKLDEDLQGTPGDPTRYCGMVGSLMYLTFSRPDLVFSVYICARYQEKPIEKHLHAVKQVFQYLKRTINMGIWFSKDTGIALTAYADADHVGYQDTRRSTSGNVQLLGDRLVSWSSKKQKSNTSQPQRLNTLPYLDHSRSKQIDVRYHFIKDQVKNGMVELYFVKTKYQLADIFTKALAQERFEFLLSRLGMKSMSLEILKSLAESKEE
nr:copia protein [Tanacetum cinerariifolium]